MNEFFYHIEKLISEVQLSAVPIIKEPKNTDKSESKIECLNYGCLAENFTIAKEKYLITTAIAYTNGYPHIGHAYEFLTSDILARYHRLFGRKTYFLTGSDEHGQKVANSAEQVRLDNLFDMLISDYLLVPL
jgi:valyl-tRNA synthetase